MKTIGKIIIGVLILILLAAIYPALYLSALNSVDVKNAKFSEIGFTLQGITVRGGLELENSGFVDVTIDEITYSINLENTNQLLGKGRIEGSTIPAGGSVFFPFEHKIDWKPSLETAQQLLRAEEVNIDIMGKATATFLGIPFTETYTFTVDISEYLQNYVDELIQSSSAVLQELAAQFGFV